MKPKAIVKITVDILMTFALLFLTGYQLWGEAAHEIAGTGLFILFILHHILNFGWYQSLFKGKYTAVRIFQMALDLSVLLVMFALMYSGITMSRHVFGFLPRHTGLAMARRLHILGSYWGFLLMSLHLGLHWSMILGMFKKGFHIQKQSKIRTVLCRIAGIVIAGYGFFIPIKRDFITYLFLKQEFVFLDYDESIILFYIDYLAWMGLCILAAHYTSKLLRIRPGAL